MPPDLTRPLSRRPDRTPTGPIRLCSVSVAYAGSRVLHSVSAELAPASITVVTGANGAGKSTLLSVLAGVLPLTAGAIEGLDGRSLAFVPQRSAVPEHFPITAREVVSMGRWAGRRSWLARSGPVDREVVRRSLDRLDVGDLAGRTFGELSGGQRQRVLVAQALAREAGVLLLDEPTVGLDAASGRAIRRVLRAEAERGALVVEVSHDRDAVAGADARLHLEAGCRVPVPAG